MWLSLFISILLLATIGGISHPSMQILFHSLLAACCLLVGKTIALDTNVMWSSMGIVVISGIILSIILARQSFHRSFTELFLGLMFVILSVSLIVYILPPSLPRLEYAIVFSIILVGTLYSILSKSVGGQVIGVACALNALSLIVGLNGQYFALGMLFVFYLLFLSMSLIVVMRLGRFSS